MLCRNTLNGIDSGNTSADEVLKDRRKMQLKQPSEFLTCYIGNLHFAANTYQIKKAVENATGIHVDDVVIAKTSPDKSCSHCLCVYHCPLERLYLHYLRLQRSPETHDDD